MTRSGTRTLGPARLRAAERLRHWGRATLTFLLGLVAFPIGVGLGLPHLAKEGLTPATVAGLASLAAGAVLLLVGGSARTSMCPGSVPWVCGWAGRKRWIAFLTASLGTE